MKEVVRIYITKLTVNHVIHSPACSITSLQSCPIFTNLYYY